MGRCGVVILSNSNLNSSYHFKLINLNQFFSCSSCFSWSSCLSRHWKKFDRYQPFKISRLTWRIGARKTDGSLYILLCSNFLNMYCGFLPSPLRQLSGVLWLFLSLLLVVGVWLHLCAWIVYVIFVLFSNLTSERERAEQRGFFLNST